MKSTYSKSSPYYKTASYGNFLDVMTYRTFPARADDVLYTIDAVYKNRPDLLAYDLYGDSRLWWVFAQRNPNTLKDPLFDFTTGTKIYIPKITTLRNVLGF